MLRIKLVKSAFGNNPRNRATIEALGLRRVGHIVEHADNPSIRGMIHKVKHLLVVEVPEGGDPIIDATSPGSSARLINVKLHKFATEEAPDSGDKK